MKRTKHKPSPLPADANPLEPYRLLLSAEEFSALQAALTLPLPQAVRINPLKLPADAIQSLAQRYGWQVQPVAFCPSGWQILSAQTPPSRTIEFKLGGYYIQDAASMLPAELFTIGEAPLTVLDLAAAPGGKTTHLVSRLGDRGLVVANDSSASRVSALRGVLQDWGAINVAVTQFPGERMGQWLPEQFDAALLDAPCSMENLRASETGHGRRDISDREHAQLANRQLRLLISALQAVRVGGQVVYSTCTLAPLEDEGVLDELLQLHPTAVRIENLHTRLPQPAPGLTGDGLHSFDPSVQHAARLWPHRWGTAGFFTALITKTDHLPTPEASAAPGRGVLQGNIHPLGRRETLELCEYFLQTYGFDLPALLEQQALEIWQRSDALYLLPQRYFSHFPQLACSAVGMLLGETATGRLAPSHEWAARFGKDCRQGKVILPADLLPAWLRGEDVPQVGAGLPPGMVAIVQDEEGRSMGRARVLSAHLKNLLPRRLAG